MQPFSPSPIGFLAVLTTAERMAALQQLNAPIVQAVKDNAQALILLIVLSHVANILCNWAASKIVALEESRFTNALKTYVYYIGMIILIVFAGVFTFIIAAGFGGTQAIGGNLLPLGVALLFGVLFIAVAFAVPMTVYKISFARSLGFVLITVVLQGACHLALNHTIGRDLVAKDSPFQQAIRKVIAQSATGQTANPSLPASSDADSDERIAADKTRSIVARQAALSDLYNKLESMYQSLPPGQTAARAAYETRKARYEGLLAELRADAARGR